LGWGGGWFKKKSDQKPPTKKRAQPLQPVFGGGWGTQKKNSEGGGRGTASWKRENKQQGNAGDKSNGRAEKKLCGDVGQQVKGSPLTQIKNSGFLGKHYGAPTVHRPTTQGGGGENPRVVSANWFGFGGGKKKGGGGT